MASVVLCPSCRSVVPVEAELRPSTFPFCSKRCQLSDLGHWFNEDYRLPRPITPDDDDAIQMIVEAREGDG